MVQAGCFQTLTVQLVPYGTGRLLPDPHSTTCSIWYRQAASRPSQYNLFHMVQAGCFQTLTVQLVPYGTGRLLPDPHSTTCSIWYRQAASRPSQYNLFHMVAAGCFQTLTVQLVSYIYNYMFQYLFHHKYATNFKCVLMNHIKTECFEQVTSCLSCWQHLFIYTEV